MSLSPADEARILKLARALIGIRLATEPLGSLVTGLASTQDTPLAGQAESALWYAVSALQNAASAAKYAADALALAHGDAFGLAVLEESRRERKRLEVEADPAPAACDDSLCEVHHDPGGPDDVEAPAINETPDVIAHCDVCDRAILDGEIYQGPRDDEYTVASELTVCAACCEAARVDRMAEAMLQPPA